MRRMRTIFPNSSHRIETIETYMLLDEVTQLLKGEKP